MLESAERADHLKLHDHVVLCGLDRLGVRTLEELIRLGQTVVVIVASSDPALRDRAIKLGAYFVIGDYRQEATLTAARLDRAKAIVIVEDDDVGNFHAALSAREIQPGLRFVLRMFNLTFGEQIKSLFQDCGVLSATSIAAPAFVAAAIYGNETREIAIAGEAVELKSIEPGDPDVILPVAARGTDDYVLFPEAGDAVLGLVRRRHEPHEEQRPNFQGAAGGGRHRLADRWRYFSSLLRTSDRRLRWLLLTLLFITFISTVIFSIFYDLSPLDALYFTVTVITTTGFGDISLRDASPGLKLFGMGLMLLGAASLAVLYAIITDAVVGLRLTRALGRPHPGLRDHVVVCGVGTIGFRIVDELYRHGIPFVGIEQNESGRFVPLLRAMGAPIVIGDVRLAPTLLEARIGQASALVAATDDDFANLAAALNARSLSADVRLVLRLFEPELADKVEAAFGASLSRSVSSLAAPAFAAAALGEQVLATIPVGDRLIVIARDEITEHSPILGWPALQIDERITGKVIAVQRLGVTAWRPAPLGTLATGDRVIVAATRQGYADFQALVSGRHAGTRHKHPPA